MHSNRFNFGLFIFLFIVSACTQSDTNGVSGATGQGGSLARFAIKDHYMYVVTHNSLNVYDISINNFKELSKVNIEFGLETIFAKGDYLYLGGRDAMYIYSITTPSLPSFIFRYSHITSCDPVVVHGNKAYVTLRSGTSCNLGSNALEIIDITNPLAPVLIANYPMTSPGGLGIDGNCLFICEGEHGLKMFNVENPLDIKIIKEITHVNAYDVIVGNGLLKLTGEDGIFQYEYDCSAQEINLLSKIPVVREVL